MFSFNIKKLVDLINSDQRFEKTDKLDERLELIYDLLLQTHDTSSRD